MSELKPFLINIEGTYCEVPHKDRKMLLFNDSDESLEDAEKLTMIDILIICHEVLCNLKRKMQKVMTNSEIKNHSRNYERYHFGKSTGKEKLKTVGIQISGVYCDEFNIDRKIQYTFDLLPDGQAIFVLVEIVCFIRNKLAETMNRAELSELAVKHEIHDFGMRADEEPFETR